MADLDFADEPVFVPIFRAEWVTYPAFDEDFSFEIPTPFQGVFEGNGHVISNITITGSTLPLPNDLVDASYAVGLFSSTSGATIQNLGLKNCMIDAAQPEQAGGIIGSAADGTTLRNCYVTGAVRSAASAGGLVGEANALAMIDCYSLADVHAAQAAGGLVGDASKSTVRSSYSAGNIEAADSVGGLIGSSRASAAPVAHSYYRKDTAPAAVGGQNDSAFPNVKVLTPDEMRAQASFAGFAFGSHGAWVMPTSGGCPLLKNVPDPTSAEPGGGDPTPENPPPQVEKPTPEPWWRSLPSFVQWLLRIFCFGWIWMQ
jgi:hypothetical protein